MKQTDAVVFMLLGQSNAVGHILPMRQEDKIHTPLKNVFGLSRTWNQSFHNQELVWTGYTSSEMNLAEEQDDTYSVANCLAQLWQDKIDGGAVLPDLYIVHIAIGAQGITRDYMWYPDREECLIPGPLGTVDISLYPFTLHICSLLRGSFEKMGKTFRILGLHWRGGEEDADVRLDVLETQLYGLYQRMFREIRQAIGVPTPIVLHYMACPDRMLDQDPSGRTLQGMHYVNHTFDALCQSCGDVSVFDVKKAPQYIPDVRGNGLFLDIDVVHFTEEVNRWVAQTILEEAMAE